MLKWFMKNAPIRSKFRVLIGLQGAICGAVFLTTWLAGGSAGAVAAAGLAVVASVALQAGAARLICTPYVNTVLRMEGLAAGDTASPVAYTDYSDCVGRMTKAMARFRDNAIELENGKAAQERVIVDALSAALGRMSKSDLDVAIVDEFPDPYDTLRKDFNEAVTSLTATIRAVRSSAASVHNGATEIRAASDDLAQRNERQAANLEETASAMNQVTENVRRTAERATTVQQTVATTHREAADGGMVVSRATDAMAAIEKSAQEIGQIISVIDGIAFQTNLLALNAGVEAARAGEAGRGFAVVATEVRGLAQRSADAAQNIKELITASSRQVDEGVTLVAETGALLEKIVVGVGAINGLMTEIADNANAQSLNLQQINATVSEMDAMTQQNAAMVEQSTAASRSLADEANQLTALVAAFATGEPVSKRDGSRPVAKVPRRSLPPVRGTLALNLADQEDWTEF